MKKIIVSVFFVFLVFVGFSQAVSIELSIEWKNNVIKLNDSIDLPNTPYLNITYRNNTSKPLYFLKIQGDSNNLPPFVSSWILLPKKAKDKSESYNLKKSFNRFSKFKYFVELSGSVYGSLWYVMPYEDRLKQVQEDSYLFDWLADVYTSIFKDAILQKKETSYFEYKADDITEIGLTTKLRNNFVFLKAGENFTDSFNLVGFQILGGDYSFSVRNDILSNFVEINPAWDESQKKWIYQKTSLPPIVEGYSLYSGMFYSNNVDIKFTDQEDK